MDDTNSTDPGETQETALKGQPPVKVVTSSLDGDVGQEPARRDPPAEPYVPATSDQSMAETRRRAAMNEAAVQQKVATDKARVDGADRHQPPAEGTVREFADHMDRAQQGVKDWVRKELGLFAMNKSHDERVAENP